MVELLGYLAIVLSLIAMAQKRVIRLRAYHMLSAILYIAYGIHIEAMPLIVGAGAFLIIHSWHLYKLTFSKN